MAQGLTELFGKDFDSILKLMDGMPAGMETMLGNTIDKMLFDVQVFGNRLEQSISTMSANGMTTKQIEGILKNDMKNGGRIFGELRNSSKESIVEGVNQSSRLGQFEQYGEKDSFAWVTVGGHKVCPDCDARAGEVRSWDEWTREGLPASGWSFCRGWCYCVLDPVGKMDKRVTVKKAIAEKGASKRRTIPSRYQPMTSKEATPWVKREMARAKLQERGITKALLAMAEDFGGKLHGLKFRFKGTGSAVRKFQKESLENFWGARTVVAEDLSDLLRYTVVVDKANYGADVLKYFKKLEALGYKKVKVKNYWNGTEYKGLNTNWINPKGTVMEIQFNTPVSQYIKDKFSHSLYEEIRAIGISAIEKERLEALMISHWSKVNAPAGWKLIENFHVQTSYPAGWNILD